jgi:flagellar hook assembly protein FlgD
VAGNWKSASELSGWASPGKENSVFTKLTVTDDVVELSAERISPDNNGYEDVLVINLKLQDGGNVVSVRIFDESGSLVRKLAESLYVDSAASLCWDGTSGDGSVLNRGIYIILVSVFNEKGRIQKWKKTCTVIR